MAKIMYEGIKKEGMTDESIGLTGLIRYNCGLQRGRD